MQSSSERILTTHCGSLPRPPQLSDLLLRQEAGEAIDQTLLERECADAVAQVIAAQIAAGVDIISDGEQPRVGFSMYVPMRMQGFGGETKRPTPRDLDDFPLFAKMRAARMGRRNRIYNPPMAIGEVRYVGLDAAQLRNATLFAQALAQARTRTGRHLHDRGLARHHRDHHGQCAITIPTRPTCSRSPASCARSTRRSPRYGFVLQLDAPDFGLERARMFKDRSEREFLDAMALNVEAINRAIAGIPREQVRLHICWGNWEGPHTHDVPLATLLPLLYRAKVGALSIEFANPRHQHEYAGASAAIRCRRR